MVAPLLGIGAAVTQGLLGAQAAKRQKEREALEKQKERALTTQVGAAQALSQGQQSALQRLVEGFGKALR